MTDLALVLGIALSSRPYLVLTQGGNTSVVGNNTFSPRSRGHQPEQRPL